MMKETLRILFVIPVALTAIVFTIPILLVGLPFWVLSVAVRYIPKLWEAEALAWKDLVQYDPEIGWKPKPNLDAYHLATEDDLYRTETDAEGWPGRDTTIEESDVVVFGDSYASCYGANPGSTFIDFNPDIQVKAIGAPGYNMVQELLLMKQMSERLENKLVVWFIYLENDLPDNMIPGMAGYRTPFVRRNAKDKGWEIVTEHLDPSMWSCGSRGRQNELIMSKLCTNCDLSERIYSACNYLIAEGQKVVRDAGAELVVMTIPYSRQLSQAGLKALRSHVEPGATFDPDYPDRVIGKTCMRLGIPFIASKEILEREDYKRFEKYHWTESGHRKAAQLIREIYESHRTGKLQPISSRAARVPLSVKEQRQPPLRSSSFAA